MRAAWIFGFIWCLRLFPLQDSKMCSRVLLLGLFVGYFTGCKFGEFSKVDDFPRL